MKNFMKHDFTVSKIALACLVKAGTGATAFKNRRSYGIALFLGGERTFYFDNKTLHVEKNTLVFFPKGSNYTIKEKVSYDCYAINFQMPEDVDFEPFALKIKYVNTYLDSFKSSKKAWDSKTTGYAAKIKSELSNILFHMQAEYKIPYANSAAIEPAVRYIHSNYYKEAISIPHLAELCNISTVHLRNRFVQEFAMPPIRYINSLKMARAEDLLLSQLYTVSEVCYLSGYNDESYFCREFKKFFHVSPSNYKKASRQ